MNATLGEIKEEENCKTAKDGSAIKACRNDVVESHPPAEVIGPDVIVEDEADDGPGYEVDSASWGHGGNACEEDRNVHVAPKGSRVFDGENIAGNGEHSSDEEEPKQGRISDLI